MSIRILLLFITSLFVSGCVAPALMLSPQSQLLWALLKPMVGLDPNEANFFEQPMIKSRLQPLLGENYDTAVTLLSTATELQQQGPMFFLVSKHSPIPAVAEKAGFVWNSDTNQMAVLLVSGGAPAVFAEQVKQQGAQVVPTWPDELIEYTDPAKLREKALAKAATSVTEQLPIEGKTRVFTESAMKSGDIKGTINKEIAEQQQHAIDDIKAPVVKPFNDAKQQVKDKIDLKKQTVTDKVKQTGKELVGKDEAELSDEQELAAELSVETANLSTKPANAAPTQQQLAAVKQAEIRVEQSKVLLAAAKQKEQTASNKTEAKALVFAAKEQLKNAEKTLAETKAAAGI